MSGFPGYLETRSWKPEELLAGGFTRARYTLRADLIVDSDKWGRFTIPEGFHTDLASIPRFAFAYIAPDDSGIEYPSVPHDWLYGRQGMISQSLILTKDQVDDLLADLMRSQGARADQVAIVRKMVGWFGGSHWMK